jgi:probable rRNA maturation factor
MLKLEYYNETKNALSGKVFIEILDVINDHFKKIYPKELDKRKTYYITLTLVNDKFIKKINKKFRDKNEPTDIVSLSYLGKEFPGQDMIGEIFISVETAEKQAEKLNHELLTELKFLFVHGVLHILGYEHKSERDFEVMMDLTNKIMDF